MNWKKKLCFVALLGFLATIFTPASGRWTQTLRGGLFLRALIVDPSDPSILYLGTDEGGVFRSTDKGANWQSINNGQLTPLSVLLNTPPGTPEVAA